MHKTFRPILQTKNKITSIGIKNQNILPVAKDLKFILSHI